MWTLGEGGVLLGMVPSLILKCVRIQTDYLYAASCIDYIMLHTVRFNRNPKNIFYKSLWFVMVEWQRFSSHHNPEARYLHFNSWQLRRKGLQHTQAYMNLGFCLKGPLQTKTKCCQDLSLWSPRICNFAKQEYKWWIKWTNRDDWRKESTLFWLSVSYYGCVELIPMGWELTAPWNGKYWVH